jgi:tryptophan-rich sensory protein
VVETNHQFVSVIFLLLLGIGVTYSLAFLAILSLLAANVLAGLLVIAVIAISVSKLLGYFSDEKRQSSLASVS